YPQLLGCLRRFRSCRSAITRDVLIAWLVFALLMPRFKTWTVKPGQLSHRVRDAFKGRDQPAHRVIVATFGQSQLDGTAVSVLAKSQTNAAIVVGEVHHGACQV